MTIEYPTREERLEAVLERFVFAVEGLQASAVRQNDIAEQGLELSRQHVVAQAQMIKTSESLEKTLEDRLVDEFTPKSGGRT